MIKEYNDSTWQGKAYSKIVDTTQQVTSFPVVVRPMENTLPSWTIKGNLVQDDTPSPSNIIYPSETGERTGNLFDISKVTSTTEITNNGDGTLTVSGYPSNASVNLGVLCPDLKDGDIATLKFNTTSTANLVLIRYYDSSGLKWSENWYSGTSKAITSEWLNARVGFYQETGAQGGGNATISNIILNTGSTALPYQPYGYKLDIKSDNTTTPVYLGEVETTRKIKKLVLDGTESWTYESEYTRFYTEMSDFITQGTRRTQFYLSHYQCISDGRPIAEVPNNAAYSGQINDLDKHKIYIKTDAYNTVADFKTYLQQQYANGTPVTIWYILTNETTTTLNEPLRKIGNYADLVSGTNLSVIAQSPTTIDVDTSLKPSEMDLTYTGLKMCDRKKYAHGNSPQILPSAKAESRTSGNITLACDGNGVYTLVGSPTPNTSLIFNIPPTEIPLSVGGGGNGTLSLFNDSVYNNFDIIFVYQGTQYREAVTYSPNTINKTSTTYGSNSSDIGGKTIISIGVHITGYGNINCTFSPMITNDGQLPSTFQPYCSWQ